MVEEEGVKFVEAEESEPKTQPDVRPDVYEARQQEQRITNFLTQTSPSAALESIDMHLKGYTYNVVKKEWKRVADPIPELIRNDVIQFLNPDLSDNTRMSRLDEHQINGIMESTIEWAVDYLDSVADGVYEWKIKDKKSIKRRLNILAYEKAGWTVEETAAVTSKSNEEIKEIWKVGINGDIKKVCKLKPLSEDSLQRIFMIICKSVLYTILRSQAGREREEIFNSLRMGEQLNPQKEEKGGMGSIFKFWK